MDLPRELIDAVVSNFVRYRPEIQSSSYTSRHHRTWDWYVQRPEKAVQATDRRGTQSTVFAIPELDYRTLLSLRLVSRAWCASATYLLSKHFLWSLNFDLREHLEKAQKAVACATSSAGSGSRDEGEDIVQTNNSLITHAVRRLMVSAQWTMQTFSRTYDLDLPEWPNDDEFEENYDIYPHDDHMNIEGCLRYSKTWKAVKHHDKTADHAVLRRVFDNLHSVEMLELYLPEVWSTYRNGYESEAKNYDDEGVDEMLKTIQYGLRSPGFSSLVDLRLEVPTTHDVGTLADALSLDARQRLRHLQIDIVDATGPSGSRDYMCEEYNWDGDATGYLNSMYLPSTRQHKFPNRKHQGELFAFVSSCRNLESLGIAATHYLEIEKLDWKPLRGLKVLSLNRFWAHDWALIKLLSPLPDSPLKPAIVRVNFQDVKLDVESGDWSNVLRFLRLQCPDLEYSHFRQCTYFEEHPNHEHNNRPWENVSMIWTDSKTDSDEHNELAKVLAAKAGGSVYYPDAHDFYDVDWDEEGSVASY